MRCLVQTTQNERENWSENNAYFLLDAFEQFRKEEKEFSAIYF